MAPEQESNARLRIRRIVVPQHNSGMVDQAKAFAHFANQVRKMIQSEPYDLVFATSSRLMTAVLASWVAKKKKAKLYLDIRDIFVDTLNDILPGKFIFFGIPLLSFLEKSSLNRANRINLVSKGFESYFKARYPEKEFRWFTNGIDNEFILPLLQEDQCGSSSKPYTVLYAGNIGVGQGLHKIVPLLAKRMEGQIQFKIIGDGGRKALLELELKKEACTNVALLPPMNRKQLIDEYQKADVLFLHLNDYEAFKKVLPSKLFEYAAVGKPIWAGISGYSADFVKTEISNAEIFTPCDILEAEKVFGRLVIARHNRSEFIEKYSRQKIMQDMAEDIVSLISPAQMQK